MPAFIKKNTTDILRHALTKLVETTPLTAIGPGSIVRSLAEVVTTEISDFYSIMDFTTSMTLISSSQGRALDLIGSLYDVKRKNLTELATIDETIGAFYFYITEPYGQDITIPAGVRVFTSASDYVGARYVYNTTKAAFIPAGRLRAYVSLAPDFTDSIFTAGANTLNQHNFQAPAGVVLRCTNPKPVAAQSGLETDNNYRTRIIKSVRASAGGTVDSLRFTALAVPGIRDVKIRNTPLGLGSVEVIVVPEDNRLGDSLLSTVRDALTKVQPVGVRSFVRQPDYIGCDIRASLILRPGTNTDPSGTARRADIGVQRYLNRLLPGEVLIYVQLIQSILDASDAIADVTISQLRIGGGEVLRRNYKPEGDQQIVPGDISIRSIT